MDEALIERLYRELRPMAVVLARRAPSLYDAEDLLQIGMLKVVRVVERNGNTYLPYLKQVARNMMKRILEEEVFASSLDAYLYDEELDRRRDIAAPTTYVPPRATNAQRSLALSFLDQCTPRQRAILLAYYGIVDRHSNRKTVEGVCRRLRLTREQFFKRRLDIVYQARKVFR